jgi:hypothetical protein
VGERDTLRKAYDLSNATNSRLVAQIDGLQKAEKETGEAYLRLRGILGAFRTPHGPTCEQVWAHTEERARELQARVGDLEAAIGALSTYVPCAVWDERVLPCLARTPAQSVAHIEAAVLRRVAAAWYDNDPYHGEAIDPTDRGVIEWLERKADLLGSADEVAVTVCTECVQPYESHRPACPYCLERDA